MDDVKPDGSARTCNTSVSEPVISATELNASPLGTDQTVISSKDVKVGYVFHAKDNVELPSTEQKKKTCVYYTKNQCRHGMKGKNCSYAHPVRCKKLMEFGTKSPAGCNLGKKCSFFHPKMCPSSISKKVCFDEKCQFTHVKGTKRKVTMPTESSKSPSCQASSTKFSSSVKGSDAAKPVSSLSKKSQEPVLQIPSPCPVTNGSSETSFLDVISLLKKELSEAVETKIAMALSQIQPYRPRHLNPPFMPMMHQPIPTYPFYPQLPQFPPML